MARSYKRDARGRFAGGGGSSRPKVTGGTLKARTSARRSKAKLAAKDPADQSMKGMLSRRSQKGAVTKASKALQAAQQSGRVRLSGRGGVIRPGKGGAKKAVAAAPPKPVRPVKTNADILRQTRRIIEKADARKRSTAKRDLGSANHFRNDRWIKGATAIRQAILNPPKPKKPKKSSAPRGMSAADRRWYSSMDAWNRARGR